MPKLPTPWKRAGRDGWYVTVNQTQTKLQAESESDAYAEVREIFAPAVGVPKVKDGTLPDLVRRFLDYGYARGLHDKTVRSNRYELKWLVKLIGEEKGATAMDADSIGAAARREEWSDSHRHNVLATVQRFARWCGLAGFAVELPAKESRGADAVIGDDVWRVILRETTGDFHQLLRVLWNTGARPTEISSLTAESVDWKNDCAVLRDHKTKKKGKGRTVHFGTECMTVLKEQRSKYPSGLLFRNNNGAAWNAQTLCVKLSRLCEKAGVKTTSYCFRHTFATRLLNAGVPDTHVAAMLGHTSTRMIHKHYSHVSANGRLLSEIAKRFG